MPTPTYTPIANVTFGSTTASATFSSVSQSYRDIIIVINNIGTTAENSTRLQFNNDTGTNYSFVQMYGSGSGSGFSNSGSLDGILGAFSSNTWGQTIVHIMDYSATDKHKTVLVSGGHAGLGLRATASRWANTGAITTIKVLTDGGSYAAGSSIALYGIAS